MRVSITCSRGMCHPHLSSMGSPFGVGLEPHGEVVGVSVL